MKYENITGAQLWTQYVSQVHPHGMPPEQYRQLKMCFYSGMMEFFTQLTEIDQMSDAEVDADQEGMIMENFRQDIVRRKGKAEAGYKEWLRQTYSGVELHVEQTQVLEETFYRAMEIGFHAMSILAGPNDEDDSVGARRMIRLRTEIFSELGRMVGAA